MANRKKPNRNNRELEGYLHESFERLYFEEEFVNKKKRKAKKKKKAKPQRQVDEEKLEREFYRDFVRMQDEEEGIEEMTTAIEKIIQEEFGDPDFNEIDPEELTYKGKYISEEFNDIMFNIGKASKKHPQDILDNPKFSHLVDGILQDNKMTTYKTVPALAKYLIDTGKDFVTVSQNGVERKMSVENVIEFTANMEQTIRGSEDVVYIGLMTVHKLDGKITVFLPESDEDFETIWDFINTDKAEYLIYEPK